MKTKRSIYLLVALMSVALVALMLVQYVWLSSAIKIKGDAFNRNVLNAMRTTATALEEKNSIRFLADKMKTDSLIMSDAPKDDGLYQFIEAAADKADKDDEPMVVTINNSPGEQRIVLRKRIHDKVTEERTEIHKTPPPPPPAPPAPPVPVQERKANFITVMNNVANEYACSERDWHDVIDSALLVKTMQRQFQKFALPADYSYAVINSDNDSVLLTNNKATGAGVYKFETELMGFNFGNKGLMLRVDFPSRFKYVLVGLKGLFAMSLLFSAIIIAVFVLALQLIFRQRKLNEITNDFITNMTHEFKTPLATISMTADTLQLATVNNQTAQVKEYAAMIKEETGKLSNHVDRILEAASQEKHKGAVVAVADLNKTIEKQLAQCENFLAQHNAKIQLQFATQATKVIADEEQLGFAIANLLDNAVKYSTGVPQIDITTEIKQATVLLKIADKGIGISKENRKLIFEKFFRAHTGNVHDVKGFGLGLSFVKHTVESWGGKVWVESEPGKGSTFFIELKTAGA